MAEDARSLAGLIDQAVLAPGAAVAELEAACREAARHRFAALVVHGWQAARARSALGGSGVKVCAVVGYPLGAVTTTVKILEAMEALKNGAEELDIVMNIGMLRSGRPEQAEIDVKNVIAMTRGAVQKVIIETGLLSPDETAEACRIAVRAGAAFIKTCTGYGPRGVTVEDVRTIRAAVGSTCRIKAAGGIRDLATLRLMLDAGADRIGTSAGPAIMEELLKQGS